MNQDDFVTFEDRNFLRPEVSRDEQLRFIDTLRDTQARNTAQINADTYRLGTQVPSQFGGLGGAQNTFEARYQRPQTEQTVADLRTAAQSTALNTALSNLQNVYKKRYNDAMLNYQKRAAAAAATPSNNNNGDTDPNFKSHEEVNTSNRITTAGDKEVVAPNESTGGSSVYEMNPDGSVGKWKYDTDAKGNVIKDKTKEGTGYVPASTSVDKNTGLGTMDWIDGLWSAGFGPLGIATWLASKAAEKTLSNGGVGW